MKEKVWAFIGISVGILVLSIAHLMHTKSQTEEASARAINMGLIRME